jgi:hypothetical protein
MEQATEANVVKLPPRAAPRSLVTKLAEVMAEVERVPKNGHNTNHGYDFVTEADITQAVRRAMSSRKLMMVPTVEKTSFGDLPTKAGGNLKLCTMSVRFDVMDGESGELLSVTVVGQGSDSGDKSAYKAMTGATKYALLKLFLIPTGDDPENEKPVKPQPPPPPGGTQALKSRMPPPPPPTNGSSVRAGHDRALIYPFGTCKGHAIGEQNPDGSYVVDEKSLLFWTGKLQTENQDQAKSKWHAKNAQTIATLQAEQRYRSATAQAPRSTPPPQLGDDDGPPPLTDEDAPF